MKNMVGKTRVCRDHRGKPLPLNADHFRDYKNGSFSPQCRKCINLQRRGLMEGKRMKKEITPPVPSEIQLFLYTLR